MKRSKFLHKTRQTVTDDTKQEVLRHRSVVGILLIDNSTGQLTFHVLFDIHVPELPDTIAGEEAIVAEINRTQTNDDNATNSLHFTL